VNNNTDISGNVHCMEQFDNFSLNSKKATIRSS